MAEYIKPKEWGKWISLVTFSVLPLPTAKEVVAHSPTPSMVKTAASSNGDGKNAEAAWLKWCSEKSNLLDQSVFLSRFSFKASSITDFWNSLSLTQTGKDVAKLLKPLGAKAK